MNRDKFINQIEIEDVPWDRLPNFYARSTNFPKLFYDIDNGNVESLKEIKNSIVHQDTIMQVTPFAFLFLCKLFQKNKMPKVKEVIETVMKAVKYNTEYFESRGKVITLKELLKEENLFPEFVNQETENDEWGEFDFGRNANSWFYNILAINNYFENIKS